MQGMPLLKNNPLDCSVNSPYAERPWKRDFAVCGQRQGTLSPCPLQAFKEGKILASKNQPKLLILRFYSFFYRLKSEGIFGFLFFSMNCIGNRLKKSKSILTALSELIVYLYRCRTGMLLTENAYHCIML